MRLKTTLSLVTLFLVGSIVADAFALASGLPIKLFWAYLSVAITLAAYWVYVSQMYADPPEQVVKPQPLSWIGFGFLTGAGWLIQVAQGGDAGSWCLGITALACLVIGVWSRAKFSWHFDNRSIITACVGIALFILSVFTKRTEWATVSAVCATLADLAFYEPTFRRAWRSPHEESVTNFALNSVKCVPALLALQTYSVATTMYLVMLTIVNGGFAIFLLYWQKRRGPAR